MTFPKVFQLIRDGTLVAHGVKFESGKCVVHWCGIHNSIVIWDSYESILAINGHDGKTEFIFIEK